MPKTSKRIIKVGSGTPGTPGADWLALQPVAMTPMINREAVISMIQTRVHGT